MQELLVRELKEVVGGNAQTALAQWLVDKFAQDNGGPAATWENNGGYIG